MGKPSQLDVSRLTGCYADQPGARTCGRSKEGTLSDYYRYGTNDEITPCKPYLHTLPYVCCEYVNGSFTRRPSDLNEARAEFKLTENKKLGSVRFWSNDG